MHGGEEVPCFPRPPKEKREGWGEISGGVYPHKGFPMQHFEWGQDTEDAWSQLPLQALSVLCGIGVQD